MKPERRTLLKVLVIAATGCALAASETWSLTVTLHEGVARGIARTSGAFLEWAGLPAYVDAHKVYSLGYAVRIVPECDGLLPLALIVAGVALLRARRRSKLGLLLAGLVAVPAANLLRITTTLIIGTRSVRVAEIAHELVFPLLIAAVFGLLWLEWLKRELGASPQEAARS